MNFMDYINEKGLILIPVLYIIGIALKGTKKIPDKYIPLILLVIGEIFAVLIFGLNVDAFLQGILLTGTTVYGNQIVKQLGKTEGIITDSSDTEAKEEPIKKEDDSSDENKDG